MAAKKVDTSKPIKVRKNIDEYQYQFYIGAKGCATYTRVVSLAEMTREELQEALAQTMDAIASAADHVEIAGRVMQAWSEGRFVRKKER